MRSRFAAAAALGFALTFSSGAFAQTAPSDFTYATRYDASRRVVGTIAPDPDGTGPLHYAAVRNSYDSAGRLVLVEQGQLSDWQSQDVLPSAWQGFSIFTSVQTDYDVMGRKTVERMREGGGIGPIRTLTQYSYNDQGLLECTAVRMNAVAFASLPASACSLGSEGSQGPDRITRNLYDAAGQLLKVQKAYGTSVQADNATYTYSPNGKRTSVMDANGNLAQMTYDGFDRQSRWAFPSPSAVGQVNAADYEEYGYDANGNRTSLRKRDGRVIAYGYDALNRVTSKTFPNGGARGVFYAYDLRGLQTAARFDSTSGGDAVTTAYSGFGEVASSTTSMAGISRTIGSIFNADGARTRMTYPDGQFVSYNRDGLDRFNYADLNSSTALFHTPWDAAGRVTALYRVVGGNWAVPTTFGYDGIGRPTAIAQAIGGANVTSTFGYNPAGQLASISRDNDAYAFTGHVNVDRSYVANGLNQYASAGSASFGYDANGNLTSDGTTSYAYDIENRLVSTSAGATLTYDPTGRLWQTTGGAGVTQFLYDGDQLTAEYDGVGNMLRRYVHSDGDDDPQVWYEGAGTGSPRYLYADHQGSIVGVADANGNSATINAYDEYGIPKAGNSVNSSGRFQYTGQAWIPELGMYHYKARVYSPTLGRFLQTDPVGYDDQINLYAYVANDPVNGRDPTGMMQDCGVCAADDRDNRAYLRGEISADELRERREARAAGGLAGAAIVGVAVATRGFGIPAIANWAGRALAVRAHQSAKVAWNAAWREAGTFKSAGDVGKVVGWGTGRSATADTIARTAQIDKAAVATMREGGLTRKVAEAASRLYETASKVDKGDTVSAARSQLMKRILENW